MANTNDNQTSGTAVARYITEAAEHARVRKDLCDDQSANQDHDCLERQNTNTNTNTNDNTDSMKPARIANKRPWSPRSGRLPVPPPQQTPLSHPSPLPAAKQPVTKDTNGAKRGMVWRGIACNGMLRPCTVRTSTKDVKQQLTIIVLNSRQVGGQRFVHLDITVQVEDAIRRDQIEEPGLEALHHQAE